MTFFHKTLKCICMKSVKAHANGRNKCQQLPTLLGVVGQQCCVRLHGPKSLTGFKLRRGGGGEGGEYSHTYAIRGRAASGYGFSTVRS